MRIDFTKAFTPGYRAMLGLERAVHEGGLEPLLLELVKTRASQINGCAHCLDMHTKDARALGEDEMRLHVLAAWREAPFYSDRERGALAWCEALTLLPQQGAPDEVFAELQRNFSDDEIAALTFAIVAINGWNRLAVGFHSSVGDYVSPHAGREPAAAAGAS